MQQFLKEHGLEQSESMAFGDGENDMEMLRYAGIGVAMGNSSDKVKEAADYVTDSVDNDGIEKALLHFGLILFNAIHKNKSIVKALFSNE